MVCGHLHARGVRGSQLLLGIRQVLIGHLQLTLRVGLGLLGFSLTRLLILHVLLIRRCLGIQRLLQHLVVVLRIDLCLAQLAQLSLGLVLHVLQNLHNASTVRLVCLSSRRTKLRALLFGTLLSLHEGKQPLPIIGGKCRRVKYDAESLDHAGHAAGIHLSQSSRVLGHFFFQDAQGSPKGVDSFNEFFLRRGELCGLLLADERGALCLGFRLGDGS
mmetsp:Transcript_106325/g.266335  ORF Transcript_106325/g.266335 Transcript_106325/m.266335 type:complete len:217 (-) Transcript_106325:351-1001(-)